MAKEIFTDNPHKNILVRKNNRDWLFKSVEDKSIQNIEFEVQKFLYKSGGVPYCFDYSDSGFFEEFMKGKTFNELEKFSEEEVGLIARNLAKIHSVQLDEHIINKFDNLIYDDLKYNPYRVYDLIVGDLEDWLKEYIDVNKLKKNIQILGEEVDKIVYKLSIVHGDMSGNNIFFLENKEIKFIDWTDCRIDVGVSDVVQFFFLTELEQKYQEIFIREYDSPLCFERMLIIQRIFFELYSLIYEYKKNKSISEKYMISTNFYIERLGL